MKQEEEPWIDHLKQRVNEYEKPLPENDWNHFQTKYFTPYLHKKKRIRTMRIAAVLLLLFIPFCHHFLFFTDRKAQSSLARCILTGTPAKKHYRQSFHYA